MIAIIHIRPTMIRSNIDHRLKLPLFGAQDGIVVDPRYAVNR